ncbi:uncharacterized protein CIMG_10115 [Coccidioides immitis RS]|uniref:Phosphotransferase enzyme family protein n=1 Tax=Coccidioides immitis (strain RS) TaxID=246410 RepID=A0A0E1RUF8_COCIM|nr:uncharacterized protein CIMG_10115 [Coccidioides immitis RS]EAS27510.1 hypothetical protein CIMG_10115 [Coccidioides immitis RS]
MTTRGPLLHTRWLRFVSRNFHRLFSLRCAGETNPSQVAAEEGMGNQDDLFEYTSGRWIYNEPRRLAERHLVFNVDELKKAAATAVGRPVSEIRSIRKLAEGGFNRVFDISMKDGSSLLARLPYPSTMPRCLAVASEVATLAFVRACGIPAPRVLGYSAHDNPVGVEYVYFIPPQLPKDLGSMDADEHTIACEQFRRRHVHFFYLGFTQKLNEPHSEALAQEFGLLRRRIFDNAGSPWEGLNTPLQVDIAQVLQNWSKIAAICSDGSLPARPVVISEQDAQKRAALDDSLRDVDTELEQINGFLGVGSDGWTSNELFEQAKERARSIKAEGLAAVDDDP